MVLIFLQISRTLWSSLSWHHTPGKGTKQIRKFQPHTTVLKKGPLMDNTMHSWAETLIQSVSTEQPGFSTLSYSPIKACPHPPKWRAKAFNQSLHEVLEKQPRQPWSWPTSRGVTPRPTVNGSAARPPSWFTKISESKSPSSGDSWGCSPVSFEKSNIVQRYWHVYVNVSKTYMSILTKQY
jgi:hypothetical protein